MGLGRHGREQLGEVGHLFHQAVKLQLLQAAGQGLGLDCPQLQPWLARQGDVDQDLGQHPRAIGAFTVGAQLLDQGTLEAALGGLGSRGRQLVEGGIDAIDMLKLLQQIDGGFGPHPLNAGDVV